MTNPAVSKTFKQISIPRSMDFLAWMKVVPRKLYLPASVSVASWRPAPLDTISRGNTWCSTVRSAPEAKTLFLFDRVRFAKAWAVFTMSSVPFFSLPVPCVRALGPLLTTEYRYPTPRVKTCIHARTPLLQKARRRTRRSLGSVRGRSIKKALSLHSLVWKFRKRIEFNLRLFLSRFKGICPSLSFFPFFLSCHLHFSSWFLVSSFLSFGLWSYCTALYCTLPRHTTQEETSRYNQWPPAAVSNNRIALFIFFLLACIHRHA